MKESAFQNRNRFVLVYCRLGGRAECRKNRVDAAQHRRAERGGGGGSAGDHRKQAGSGANRMTTRRIALVLGACSFLVVGCDPVRTTSQTVHLRVIASDSGAPAAGREMSVRLDDPSATGDPWAVGVSTREGDVSIEIQYTSIDRNRGSRPPASKDFVTGRRYLIKLRDSKVPEETLSVPMRVGESVKGRTYAVTVVSIGYPRYVSNVEKD